ncbi:endonuclease I family protein [Halobacillus mangrovi]|uniref:Endonuclease I n=1 Tax=Halobacillus mangrovi TaxID=402384 RepID=A0A1W6A0D2_9BACI|nr:endonuclease [Halobacillus mangrovi]ARI78972.1 endonuclease I [Halobacillus mangrovi]
MDKKLQKFISVSTDQQHLKNVLAKVKSNKTKIKEDDRVYFDRSKNEEAKAEYYKSIDFLDKSDGTMEKILELIQSTHQNELRYDPSDYVYPWVDLRPDGKLQSIYSGEKREPEDVIQEDYEVSKKRKEKMKNNEGTAKDPVKMMEEVAAAFKYNCEHAVPQSWFNEQEPMRGDLHHLFTCEPLCNSIRSNYPYHDFEGYPKDEQADLNRIEDQCGKAENELFEPEYAKGTVARAMLYFLLRYPGCIEASHRKKIDDGLLLEWHKQEPPEVYELHRNQAISELQGNRNPYIDFPMEMAGFAELV